ncbi:MAG: InlB B-repeat-containing protein, partial [Clostridia bacterium]|nr:InlB B-repeat-containing protein [Clostridia bacterium]
MELRKRVLSIVLSVLLIMASIPALMIPADAAGLRTLSVSAAGQSSELPLDSTAYYSAAQAVYTADELGNAPFTVQAMTINVDGAPDYGIWRSFEIYMVNVPAGTGFEDGFSWYELTEDDAVLFGTVQLYNGENVIPFRYAFDYDGESDVLMCIVSADGTVTDDPAVFGTRAGTSIVYNGDWFADVLDPDCMAETEGTLIGEIPAVTFLSNYERTVTVTATAGGTVEADYASAEAGTVVTLTAAPDEGYELMGYRVYTADGEQIEVVDDTFVVPTADVYVLGYFKNVMDGSCWFRYGTGDAESSTGLGESTMIWEIMVPADDIAMLGYDRLTAVGFYYVEEFEGDYWFTVYLNGEAVYSTSCTISGESRWVDVELEEVIELDGTQDVEIEVYTEGFVAPASFTEDCGVPYARLVWNDYYGGLIDMYDMGMPVTWLIHAQFGWDLPSYTVTLHKNSGADTTAAAEPAVINTPYAQPACPFSVTGKTFGGWSLTPGGAPVSFPVVLEEDTDLYALWTSRPCTVTYDANNGTGDKQTSTVDSGSVVTLPACPFTAAGKRFIGWALTPNGTKISAADGYTVTGNVTFYALWETCEYTVSFNANGGSGTMKAVTAEAGKTFKLPACTFTAPQYKQFAGWSLTKDGAVLTNGFTVTKDTTLYAVWKSVPCKVVYDANGGTGTPVTVTLDAGTKLILPACSYTAPANKHFAGWSLTKDGSALTGEYTVTGNVTFYALWSTTTYEVTFDANGGTGIMKAAIAESGKALTLPACTFTAPQYKQFAGWSLTKDGALLGSSYTFTKNTTLYAVWKAVPASVSFDANGGTGTMKAASLKQGDFFTLPVCTFTAPLYKQFAGWSLTKDGAVLTNGFTVTKDTTLYAVWKSVPCKVVYDANGGTGTPVTVTLDAGTKLILPACSYTAPANKHFAGWSLTKDGSALTGEYTVTGNVTFYALWSTTTYEVTFDANGGTGIMKAAIAESGKALTLPACTFTAPQYKQFAGWSLTKDGALLAKDFTVTKNTTLYAIWKAVPASVSFDANGGIGTMKAAALNLGDTFRIPACTFTAPQYKQFAGWSLTKDGALITKDFTVKENTTLYAIWKAVPASVSFDANGGIGTMKAAA